MEPEKVNYQKKRRQIGEELAELRQKYVEVESDLKQTKLKALRLAEERKLLAEMVTTITNQVTRLIEHLG